jgi:hypothetical protein
LRRSKTVVVTFKVPLISSFAQPNAFSSFRKFFCAHQYSCVAVACQICGAHFSVRLLHPIPGLKLHIQSNPDDAGLHRAVMICVLLFHAAREHDDLALLVAAKVQSKIDSASQAAAQ